MRLGSVLPGRVLTRRDHPLGTQSSLPIFTIADMNAFRMDSSYVERGIETLRSRSGRGRETRAQL
jgi:hypothetical protein